MHEAVDLAVLLFQITTGTGNKRGAFPWCFTTKKKTLLEGSPALTMSFLRFQFLKVHWLVVTAVVAGGHRYFQEAAVKNQTLQQDVGQTPEVSSSSLYSSLA